MTNRGVNILPIKKTDFIVGGVSGVSYKENMPSGDWSAYLPTEEKQAFRRFDTMGCVSYSALNDLETQMHWLLDTCQIPLGLKNWLTERGFIDEQGHFNACDRFTVKMSGTTARGNFPPKVWDSFRNHGILAERDWPASDEYDRTTYFAEIPQELKDKAKEFLKYFITEYEWVAAGNEVPLASIQYHLKHAPLQVCSATCPPWGTGVIQACGDPISHATMIYAADETIHDFDSYDPYKKYLSLNYYIPYIMKGIIRPKTFSISTEMCRFAWNKRPDLQYTYPKESALVNPKDPNDNLYRWAEQHGPYEMPEVFIDGVLDWSGIEEKLRKEEMPEKKTEKTLTQLIWAFLTSLFGLTG